MSRFMGAFSGMQLRNQGSDGDAAALPTSDTGGRWGGRQRGLCAGGQHVTAELVAVEEREHVFQRGGDDSPVRQAAGTQARLEGLLAVEDDVGQKRAFRGQGVVN